MNTCVKQTVFEMLRDRGYKNIDEIAGGKLIAKTNDITTLIYACKEDKSGIKSYKQALKLINENKCNALIFIYRTCITIFAKNEFEKLVNDNIKIELFSESELSFNITKHVLVPSHELLKQEEKINVLRDLRIDPKSLPVLTITDPVARYYNYKRGDVIRITRKSPTNGVYSFYRLVY